MNNYRFGLFIGSLTVLFFMGVCYALAGMPPARYDRTFEGRMEHYVVPYGKAWSKCNHLSIQLGYGPKSRAESRINGRHLYGCSFPVSPRLCYVVYSYSGFDKLMKSNVFRHEQAHCNGWPADHPGAR